MVSQVYFKVGNHSHFTVYINVSSLPTFKSHALNRYLFFSRTSGIWNIVIKTLQKLFVPLSLGLLFLKSCTFCLRHGLLTRKEGW